MSDDYRCLSIEMRDAYFLIQDASIVILSGSELAKMGYDEKAFVGLPLIQVFPPKLNKEFPGKTYKKDSLC